MGISGLHTFLKTYGEKHQFTLPPDQVDLIIDGSALAYHLWREGRCLEGSYRQFSKHVHWYMRLLHRHASTNITIFFDGYLPPHKRQIRIKRTSDLVQCVRKNTGSLIANTPKPPFAVHVLRSSIAQWAKVSVVKQEADVACAKAALDSSSRGRKCYLLSFDADMYCFDLGEAHYMPLDLLSVSDQGVGGMAFNHSELCRKLKVDIVDLAALCGVEGSDRYMAPWDAYRQLLGGMLKIPQVEVSRAKSLFCLGQASIDCAPTVDGMLSEVLNNGEAWLPQLLENANTRSPWSYAADVRAAAYHLLCTRHLNHGISIKEYHRRAESVTGRSIGAIQDTFEPLSDVHAIFRAALTRLKTISKEANLGLSQIHIDALIVQCIGTYSSTIEEIGRPDMQVAARWQAIVYSFLLLCQARGTDCVNISQLYDLPTFLNALKLRRSGIAFADLVRGKEAEVARLMLAQKNQVS